MSFIKLLVRDGSVAGVDPSRVQIGLQNLLNHLLLVVSKHEAHLLNVRAVQDGIYGFTTNEESMKDFVDFVIFITRSSKEILQLPAKQKQGQGDGKGHPAKAHVASTSKAYKPSDKQNYRDGDPQKCFVCKKTRNEHPDKRFCSGCFVCKKAKSAHPGGKYCVEAKNGRSLA